MPVIKLDKPHLTRAGMSPSLTWSLILSRFLEGLENRFHFQEEVLER